MTTHPPDAPPVTPADAIAAARGMVAELSRVVWAAKPAAEVLAAVTELERLRSVLAAVESEVAVEVESTEAAKTIGWVSPADYLTSVSGARRGAGKRMLRTGRALTGDRQATWVALQAGDVSPEHAEVIVAAVDRLPVDAGVRDRGEAFLLEQAAHLNASELAKAGEHLLEVVDPDRAAATEERALDRLERAAHLRRELIIREDGLGGVRLRGRGTVEDAAILKAALASLAAPTPAGPAGLDPSTGSGHRGLDQRGGGLDGLDHRGRGLDGLDHRNDGLDHRNDGLDHRGDVRDHGARCWDALVAVCKTVIDAEVLPESHGVRPRIIVTLDHDTLRSGVGAGTLETGDTLSAAAVRKLACDADLIPAVLGSRGEVLDVGRTHRLVTTAIWTALVLRDRHCAFPGCRRPPIACDAHHLQHWADHGPTSLDNLVLLCRAHHTLIHHTDWQIRLHPADRRPEFRPPPRLRRQHRHPHRHGQPVREPDDWIREPTTRE